MTAEGRRTFRAMAAAHEIWIAEIFGELTSGERANLMQLLAKVKKSAAKMTAAKD